LRRIPVRVSRGRSTPNLLCFTLALRPIVPEGAPRGRMIGRFQVLSADPNDRFSKTVHP